MKLIIPMAGMGTRMRPHTLNTPKPLLKIAGKSIVERIVEDLSIYTGKKIDEIHYVIGNFGNEIENRLKTIARSVKANGIIHYQKEALGTAHAIYCAKDALRGEVLISFADTLFIGDLKIDNQEAIIWTKEVSNPENYGVVVTDDNGFVTNFVEKPKEFISKNAIIGIYYFNEARKIRDEIYTLIENSHSNNGEYQLTDSLFSLIKRKVKFSCKTVDYWLDCGNKTEFLSSNKILLDHKRSVNDYSIHKNLNIINPVYIGKSVKIENSSIGPYVSIEDNTFISGSTIENSIVGVNCSIIGCNMKNSLIGNYTKINGLEGILNLGDYNEYERL
jgi:glucose-1-phosphate thymidylyltransferase